MSTRSTGSMGGAGKSGWVLAAMVALALGGPAAGVRADAPAADKVPATVRDLIKKDLAGAPGKEVEMLTVEYAPGASSPQHRHDAQVFVYVLSGSVRMQVKGAPVVTLGPGDTFYEGRNDVHTVSANASTTEPAKFLVFMVKDRKAPATRPAT